DIRVGSNNRPYSTGATMRDKYLVAGPGGPISPKRLIIAVQSPFLELDFERYGIADYLSKNVEIEVWDCTTFFFPRVATYFEDRLEQFPYLKVLKTENSINQNIEFLDKNTVVWIS